MDGYATVKDIRRQGDGTYNVSVEVGNGYGCELMEFVLLDAFFEEVMPDIGETDEETIGLLELLSEATEAYRSACASFAYSPCSHMALRKKLLSKRFSAVASDRAIEVIRDHGFINEGQIALRRAELMAEKLWGKTRIIAKLREELFEDSALEDAAEYLSTVDFSENCARVIEKKYPILPVERKEREKMYAALSRIGFSSSDIREALKTVQERSE